MVRGYLTWWIFLNIFSVQEDVNSGMVVKKRPPIVDGGTLNLVPYVFVVHNHNPSKSLGSILVSLSLLLGVYT